MNMADPRIIPRGGGVGRSYIKKQTSYKNIYLGIPQGRDLDHSPMRPYHRACM